MEDASELTNHLLLFRRNGQRDGCIRILFGSFTTILDSNFAAVHRCLLYGIPGGSD